MSDPKTVTIFTDDDTLTEEEKEELGNGGTEE